MRCVLSNRECAYDVPQARVFPPIAQDPAPSLPLPIEMLEPAEQRALHYFRENTMRTITGFTSYTETFWNSLIPQLSQSERAVQHIIIAIATKCEAGHFPDRADELAPFCLKHHSLALQCLTTPDTGSVDEEILLVSCVAFIFFERMHDPLALDGRYLDYVVAGLKILRERAKARGDVKPDREGFNLIDNFIEPMFLQIELAFCMFCQPDRIVYFDQNQTRPQAPQIPEQFTDLMQARDMFFNICFWRYVLFADGESWTESSRAFREIHALIVRWHNAIDAYMNSDYQDNEEEHNRAFALKQQVCLLVGALLYSVRTDVPVRCYCRPSLVDLSVPTKISIFVRINEGRKVNLSGINTGVPANLKVSGLWLWPHAKRMRVEGDDDYILLELAK